MKKEAKKTVIQECYEIVIQPYREVIDLAKYKANYARLEELKPKLIEEFKTKTIKELKMLIYRLGIQVQNRLKKEFYLSRIMDAFESLFLLKRPLIFTIGERQNALKKLIEGTNIHDLNNFYKSRNKSKEQRDKSQNDPQTLADFYVYISNNGKDSLNEEQNIRFKELKAQEQAYNQVINDN